MRGSSRPRSRSDSRGPSLSLSCLSCVAAGQPAKAMAKAKAKAKATSSLSITTADPSRAVRMYYSGAEVSSQDYVSAQTSQMRSAGLWGQYGTDNGSRSCLCMHSGYLVYQQSLMLSEKPCAKTKAHRSIQCNTHENSMLAYAAAIFTIEKSLLK